MPSLLVATGRALITGVLLSSGEAPVPVDPTVYLLCEDGGYLLCEDDQRIIVSDAAINLDGLMNFSYPSQSGLTALI